MQIHVRRADLIVDESSGSVRLSCERVKKFSSMFLEELKWQVSFELST